MCIPSAGSRFDMTVPASPLHPRLGVGVLIVRDGQVLLMRRRCDPEAGRWGLPGGKVDWMETAEHAARREVDEELGIALHEIRLLCVTDQIDPVHARHWFAPVYLSEGFSGEPRIVEPDKHAALGWCLPDEAPGPLTMSARAALAAWQALPKLA